MKRVGWLSFIDRMDWIGISDGLDCLPGTLGLLLGLSKVRPSCFPRVGSIQLLI